jgi:hypothetical protein
MKVRPDVSASRAAGLAYEPRLEIGKPDVIRPLIAADRDRVAAAKVLAIDQDTAQAGRAHFAEGNLLRAGEGGHAPSKRGPSDPANRLCVCAWKRMETPSVAVSPWGCI